MIVHHNRFACVNIKYYYFNENERRKKNYFLHYYLNNGNQKTYWAFNYQLYVDKTKLQTKKDFFHRNTLLVKGDNYFSEMNGNNAIK